MSLLIRTAAILLSLAPSALACSCGAPPPPCQAYWQTPAVFVGTVTAILETRNGFVARASMRLDHAYKGISGDSVTLFDDGMCDGPTLTVGEQYLMYTQTPAGPKAAIPSRGCTRSRSVQYAAEDLEFLKGLTEARLTGTIQGQALGRPDKVFGGDQPLPGVDIEARGSGATYNTSTDADGRFSIRNADPATYEVTATHPGYSLLEFPGAGPLRKAEVHAGGCADLQLILMKQWRGSIEGRLIRPEGSPGPKDVSLMLIRLYLDREGQQRNSPGQFSETDEQGYYSFLNLTPGRYKLVMNAYTLPSSRVPYPTIYWPSAYDEASAREIEVKDEDAAQTYDFLLPPELKTKRVTGTILLSDGSPAIGATVLVMAVPGNRSIATEEDGPTLTDADGQFSYIAAEGTDYRVTALLHTQHPPLQSPEVRFTLEPEPKHITLILEAPHR